MKLMIVEDEQRARRGLKNIILSLSAEHEIVAEAANGRSALELIKVLRPEAVFTDIKMPYMDGLELIRETRKLGLDTKFVIISAYEEFEYARQAVSLGAVEYLVKPLIMEDIVAALEAVSEKEKKPVCAVSLTKRYPDVHPVISQALKRIEADYAGPMNLKQLAGELQVSPEYLSTLFTKNIGESFVRFLRNYRIEAAKTFYCYGDIPAEEVPERVGFADEKYFKHIFKELTGMSVGDYIREHKKR